MTVCMEPKRLGGVVPEWTFTDRLTKARTFADLSQHQLAQALGISERTVKRYEAGGVYKRGIILGWALACGIDPAWLEHGGDNEPDGGIPNTGAHNLGYVRRLNFACAGNTLVAA